MNYYKLLRIIMNTKYNAHHLRVVRLFISRQIMIVDGPNSLPRVLTFRRRTQISVEISCYSLTKSFEIPGTQTIDDFVVCCTGFFPRSVQLFKLILEAFSSMIFVLKLCYCAAYKSGKIDSTRIVR